MANENASPKKEKTPGYIRIISLIVAAVVLAINVFYTYNLTAKPDIPKEEAKPGVTDTSRTDMNVSGSDTENAAEYLDYTVGEVRLPYYITVDKVGKIVSIYTTNEEGKYEVLVRQCICAVGESLDKLPNGYYPLKNSKYKWNVVVNQGEPMRAQYTTRITGDYIFHSVPYTKMEKDSLDMKQYNNLGKKTARGYIWLTVECAKWIYDNCPPGTPVYIFKGKYDAELIEKLRPGEAADGWDPTDPDNPNCKPQYKEASEPKPCLDVPLYNYNFEWAEESESKK